MGTPRVPQKYMAPGAGFHSLLPAPSPPCRPGPSRASQRPPKWLQEAPGARGWRCHAGSWWQSHAAPRGAWKILARSPVLALLAPRAARGTRRARRRRPRRAPRFAPCPGCGRAPCAARTPGCQCRSHGAKEEQCRQALSSCACSPFGSPHAPLRAGTQRGQPGPRRTLHGLAASCSPTAARSLARDEPQPGGEQRPLRAHLAFSPRWKRLTKTRGVNKNGRRTEPDLARDEG